VSFQFVSLAARCIARYLVNIFCDEVLTLWILNINTAVLYDGQFDSEPAVVDSCIGFSRAAIRVLSNT